MAIINIKFNNTTISSKYAKLPVQIKYINGVIDTIDINYNKSLATANKYFDDDIQINDVTLATKHMFSKYDIQISSTANKVSIPRIDSNCIFNRSEQTPNWSGLDTTNTALSGDTVKTYPGTYSVTASLKDTDNNWWTDNTITPKSYTWVIEKKKVTIPTVTGSFTYDKQSHSATIQGYDSNWCTQTADSVVTATNAGTYTIKYILQDKTNTTWTDGTTDDKSFTWSIAVRQLTIPSIVNATYSGAVITPTINNFDSNYETKGGTLSATNAGTYTATFSLSDTVNTKWSDGTTAQKSINWTINKLSLTIPTLSGTYTYSGNAQTVTISDFSSTWETQSGTVTATKAGTYTVTFALKDTTNTQWSDGTTAAKSPTWTISKLSLTIPTVSGNYTYNGSAQTASISNFNSTWENQSGTTSATAVGTYTVSFTLKDTTNTQWSDSTTETKSGTWKINRASLTLPAQSNTLTYNGNVQTPTWNSNYDSTKMDLTGTLSGTNAGNYEATFTIKDTSCYQWSDGSIAAKTTTWQINKAFQTITASPSSFTYDSSTSSKDYTITSQGGAITSVSFTNTTTTGQAKLNVSYSGMTVSSSVSSRPSLQSSNSGYITVNVGATTNYQSGSVNISVTINKASCVTGDTLVMMGDGTEKPIREISLGEEVMTWSLTSGQFESQPVSVVYDEGHLTEATVIRLTLSNGTIVDSVYEHGFFDKSINNYFYINTLNYTDIIRHELAAYNKETGTYDLVTVTNAEIIDKFDTDMWSIQTAYNENFITNGILSITQEYKPGRYNYFDIDENMMWDADKQAQDIEAYGVFTYDEWKDFIEEDDFYAFNGPWFKVLICKGIITLEDIPDMIGETPSLIDDEE